MRLSDRCLGVLNNFQLRYLEGHRMMIYSDDPLLWGCFGVWRVGIFWSRSTFFGGRRGAAPPFFANVQKVLGLWHGTDEGPLVKIVK